MTNVALVARKLAVLQEHVRRLRERRPDESALAMAAASQLRNLIAHGYASLDAGRLWRELPDGTAAFERFAAAVSAFLRRVDVG